MHQKFFDMGLNQKHFDLIVLQHFEEACRDSWIEQSCIEDASSTLMLFRDTFKKEEREKKLVTILEKVVLAKTKENRQEEYSTTTKRRRKSKPENYRAEAVQGNSCYPCSV